MSSCSAVYVGDSVVRRIAHAVDERPNVFVTTFSLFRVLFQLVGHFTKSETEFFQRQPRACNWPHSDLARAIAGGRLATRTAGLQRRSARRAGEHRRPVARRGRTAERPRSSGRRAAHPTSRFSRIDVVTTVPNSGGRVAIGATERYPAPGIARIWSVRPRLTGAQNKRVCRAFRPCAAVTKSAFGRGRRVRAQGGQGRLSAGAVYAPQRKRPKARRADCRLCRPSKLTANKTADRMRARRGN